MSATPWKAVAARLPESMHAHLPRRWVQLGRVLLLRLPHALEPHAREVAAAYATLPDVETVARRPRITGELREPVGADNPGLELLHGTATETEVIEHGLRFRLDLARVMWSPGNVGWRAGPAGPAAVRRLYRLDDPQVILDCFAGVGYFALHFAHAHPAAKVVAVEKNPVAAAYLTENAALNQITNVEVIHDDCRNVRRACDVVHLGYLNGTLAFVPHVAGLLRRCGVMLYHEAYRNVWLGRLRRSDWRGVPEPLARELHATAPELTVTAVARVKSYGPGVSHLVARLEKR